MNIYVDFDDCLCETGRYLASLASELFGTDVPYEKMRYFDLQKSFSLNGEQMRQLMETAHTPEVLLSCEETPGASETVNSWIDGGHQVSIITGRPFDTWDISRTWLDRHGLDRVRLYCFNKYGREKLPKNSGRGLEMEEYLGMRFDYAVEDSPAAFRYFDHLPELKVLVYDRPWNRESEFPRGNYTRCADWQMIRNIIS